DSVVSTSSSTASAEVVEVSEPEAGAELRHHRSKNVDHQGNEKDSIKESEIKIPTGMDASADPGLSLSRMLEDDRPRREDLLVMTVDCEDEEGRVNSHPAQQMTTSSTSMSAATSTSEGNVLMKESHVLAENQDDNSPSSTCSDEESSQEDCPLLPFFAGVEMPTSE
ncbi:unnamed protein product, partial [Amoebophrya sp. A120]